MLYTKSLIMGWIIEYYVAVDGKSPVENFIDTFSPEGKAKYVFIADLLEEYGLNVKEPYMKPITGYKKIFEIRIKEK